MAVAAQRVVVHVLKGEGGAGVAEEVQMVMATVQKQEVVAGCGSHSGAKGWCSVCIDWVLS